MKSAQYREAAQVVWHKISSAPVIGLILGSGLGSLAEEIAQAVKIPYEDIPHFPVSTVPGHAGRLVSGSLMGKRVVAMQGRFHVYEGYSFDQVVFPVRTMRALGVNQIIVTNAAGALNPDFRPGQLMLIRDHLHLMFGSPLIGPNDPELGPRFPDMSQPYSQQMIAVAKKAAAKLDIAIAEGVYAAMTGPNYETPAEIRMLRKLGADAVGMSTVPEVLAARHAGMEVLGLSCLANMAAGILPQPLSHREVMETAEKVKEPFLQLMKGIIADI